MSKNQHKLLYPYVATQKQKWVGEIELIKLYNQKMYHKMSPEKIMPVE